MTMAMFLDIILHILVGGFALCSLMGLSATGVELNTSFPHAWRGGSYFLVLWLLIAVQMMRYSMVWYYAVGAAILLHVSEYDVMNPFIEREMRKMSDYAVYGLAYGFIFTSFSPLVAWGCMNRNDAHVLLCMAVVYFGVDVIICLLVICGVNALDQ